MVELLDLDGLLRWPKVPFVLVIIVDSQPRDVGNIIPMDVKRCFDFD